MNEDEWLSSSDPEAMWEFLNDRASDRKRWLYAIACWRWVDHAMTDPLALRFAEVAEDYIDSRVSEAELAKARRGAEVAQAFTHPGSREEVIISRLFRVTEPWIRWNMSSLSRMLAEFVVEVGLQSDPGNETANEFLFNLSGVAQEAELAKQAHLLREMFGNPFRPVAFDPEWRTSTTVAIARGMDDSRDFSAMPILADALQDAGCDNDAVLNHCRAPGTHVRGCWVVDLVLDKS